MTAGGELTVRVADLCEAGESSLLAEISGLGLTICSPVADADRAILTARKQIGRPGCAFAIEFPVPDRRPPKLHI